MPFRSRSQIRKFFQMAKTGELPQAEVEKWVHETHDIKSLPERIGKKKKRKR